MAAIINHNFKLIGSNKTYLIEYEQKELGKGAQGFVHRVAKINGKPYGTWAIKLLIEPSPSAQKNFRARLVALIEFMGKNILNSDAEGLSCVPAALLQSKSSNQLAILIRYAPDYDLETGGKLPELKALPQRLAIAHQLARSVRRLHEKGAVIGDLANDNIIVDHLNWALYIIDLDGIGFSLNGSNFPLLTDNSGKGSHCPPEFNSKIPYTIQMDLWGLATLLHYILTDLYPMENNLFGLARTYANSPSISWPPQRHAKKQTHLETLSLYGQPIKDAFLKSFNQGRINPSERLTALEWENLLIEAQKYMYECFCSKNKPFVAVGKQGLLIECPNCKQPIPTK